VLPFPLSGAIRITLQPIRAAGVFWFSDVSTRWSAHPGAVVPAGVVGFVLGSAAFDDAALPWMRLWLPCLRTLGGGGADGDSGGGADGDSADGGGADGEGGGIGGKKHLGRSKHHHKGLPGPPPAGACPCQATPNQQNQAAASLCDAGEVTLSLVAAAAGQGCFWA